MKPIFECVFFLSFDARCMFFRILNAVPSKISMRAQFTQVSSAEPSFKENLPAQSWHDCIFFVCKVNRSHSSVGL